MINKIVEDILLMTPLSSKKGRFLKLKQLFVAVILITAKFTTDIKEDFARYLKNQGDKATIKSGATYEIISLSYSVISHELCD